jgi:hypothetical protein
VTRLEEIIIRAVAGRAVNENTVTLAQRIIARRDAPKPPAPTKKPLPSVEHHRKARRQEEKQAEEVSRATWEAVEARTMADHRMRRCCEACHRERALEPHHLVLGRRTDAPEVVMALCADCHRLGPKSAHRSPHRFAHDIVIPWAQVHGYPLPRRKEYRDA